MGSRRLLAAAAAAVAVLAIAASPAWADLLRGRVDMLYEVGVEALDSLEPSNQVNVFSYRRHYAYMAIMNVARQMLWLPTSRVEKYKAKQAADTFIVRIGDVLSAGLVWVGTTRLTLGPRGFASANLLLVLVWLALSYLLWREYRRRSDEHA